MSELGPVNYAAEEEHIFLGHEIARQRQHSEATSIEIDREVKRIVDEALGRTRKLLDEHRQDVSRIAKALLKYEVLSAEDVDLVMKGEPLGREPSGAAPESEAKAKRA
jgi:cell division protease FtsH